MVERNAKKRGQPCLSYEEFLTLTFITECQYCGAPLIWAEKLQDDKSGAYNLDRVNNEKGYQLENLAVVCGECNWAKNVRSKEDFIEHCKRVAAYNGGNTGA